MIFTAARQASDLVPVRRPSHGLKIAKPGAWQRPGFTRQEVGGGILPAFINATRFVEFGSAGLSVRRPSLFLSNGAPGLRSALLADVDDVHQAMARVDRLALLGSHAVIAPRTEDDGQRRQLGRDGLAH